MTKHNMLLTDDQVFDIKSLLKETGHLERPFGEPQPVPENPDEAPLDDPAWREAVKSYQHFLVNVLEPLIAKHHPERRSAAPKIDGEIGPATLELFETPRCGAPDYGAAYDEEATGGGQWRSCHNIGSFHAAIVKVMNAPPGHLRREHEGGTVWDAVKRRCKECYAEVGLRLWFSDDDDVPEGNHQTELTFPGRSAGWIGLALIGQGQQCQSNPIWLRLLSTYLQSSAVTERYKRLWARLLIHELGHNTGSGHTSGGIMNPSILDGPHTWIGDPAEARMKSWFGGEKVPLGNGPDPGPDVELWSGTLVSSKGKTLVLSGVQG